MNKTVNINLSGIIFHIEEDAYGKLHSYLSTIKGYFSESEGRDEIMADIENRIAEMFSEKISDKKQVVLMTDIDRVIEVMGKPEDFAGDKAQEGETKKEQPSYSTSNKRRRVFRDPDNKILGGVCSGIANYFNIDPLWLRLTLVVSVFAFGTGFLLYIVLWIVIPQAKTAGEKLEMHGEEVNFSNIGKKVEEEIHSFGKKAESWGEEVKHTMSKHRNLGDKIVDFIGSMLGAFFRVFGKLLGLFLVLIGLFFLICIGLLFAVPGCDTFSICNGFGMLYENQQQELLASIAIFLFIGIPLIMLVYAGIKLLFGIKTKKKFVARGAGILWLVGLVLVIILGNQVVGQFADEATSKNTIELIQPKCDTLFLRVKEIKERYEGNAPGKNHFTLSVGTDGISMRKKYLLSDNGQNIYFDLPKLNIVPSESDNIEIVVNNIAMGKDRKEALIFAKNIQYDVSQKDSLIEFMPYFSIPKDEIWRNQRVRVEVRIPKGKTVYISKNMKNILFDIDNETDTYDGDMVGRRWIMSEEELRCVDCEGLIEKTSKKNKKEKIMIGPNGINIESEDEKIKIDSEGIYIEDADGRVKISKDGMIENTKPVK